MSPTARNRPSGPTLDELVDEYRVTLRARNRSPKTIISYLGAIRFLSES
jgi:hypothetical protein